MNNNNDIPIVFACDSFTVNGDQAENLDEIERPTEVEMIQTLHSLLSGPYRNNVQAWIDEIKDLEMKEKMQKILVEHEAVGAIVQKVVINMTAKIISGACFEDIDRKREKKRKNLSVEEREKEKRLKKLVCAAISPIFTQGEATANEVCSLCFFEDLIQKCRMTALTLTRWAFLKSATTRWKLISFPSSLRSPFAVTCAKRLQIPIMSSIASDA
jgi:hypothetical protein